MKTKHPVPTKTELEKMDLELLAKWSKRVNALKDLEPNYKEYQYLHKIGVLMKKYMTKLIEEEAKSARTS